MATFGVVMLIYALAQASSTLANEAPSTNNTLGIAIQEMQKANHFAFVMLLNMVASDKIPTNITFLMPNDRVLAEAIIPENDVPDFVLKHSIPAALRFDYLNHFPTGSIIPSSKPQFRLRIYNNGRKSFFLNNVKLISPDLCLSGSTVRCHGIDSVLVDDVDKTPYNNPPVTTTPPTSSPPDPPLEDVKPPPTGSFDLAPAATPQPAPRRSGSPHLAVYLWLTLCFISLSLFN